MIKERYPHLEQYNEIVGLFKKLFYERFGVNPVINRAQIQKMIKERLADHSLKGICRIVELYFEKEPQGKVYHLPNILSAYSFNKYLPFMKYDPNQISNADELNKDLY